MTGPGAAARTQPGAHRLVALLGMLGAAAALAIALLPGGGSAPAAPGIVPMRISSGHDIATGFAVAEGPVVTVAHVIDGPVTVSGRRVRVVRVDARSDLALLSVPGLDTDRPGIASAANGEQVGVLRFLDGRPSLLSVHVRRSITAHVRAPGATHALVRPALELSAADGGGRIAPGDSGAPVVTDSGELAGIVFAASQSRADTAYAVDASRLRRLLSQSSVE
jgi:S1-C subfamily serine protease